MLAGLTVVGVEIGAGKEVVGCEVVEGRGESSGTEVKDRALGGVGFRRSRESSVDIEGLEVGGNVDEDEAPVSIREEILPGRSLPTYAPLIIRSISVSPSRGLSKL